MYFVFTVKNKEEKIKHGSAARLRARTYRASQNCNYEKCEGDALETKDIIGHSQSIVALSLSFAR